MAESSNTFHEAEAQLTPATRDMHRALVSLMEELEAIDWYQQRIDATEDRELREILDHNREEEQEHAAMVLEWIRRRDPKLDANLREYLFTEGRIVGREEEVTRRNGDARAAAAPGGVGSLRRPR